ncbi:MAG: hypothetical protein ACYC5H_00215 [Methylovirgula sp.]
MRPRSAILIGLCVSVITAGSGLAQTRTPYEIVRSIQALHDQMALGSHAAQAAMPALLRKLAGRLIAAPRSAWHDPRNAHAVVVYILSGGQIRVARTVLESGKCTPLEKQLIEGAVAYLEGDRSRAKSLLGNVDPRSLESGVGSHVALAQAALLADDNPVQAMNVLDLARVLAPGTLVEDAALRREVFLAEKTENFAKFVSLSSQYLRRFRRSVYADSFRRNFGKAIVHMALLGNASQRTEVAELVDALKAQEQLPLYLHIAQSAIVEGKFGAAKWASDKAAKLAPQNSVEAHRAILYHGAASVLTTDYVNGLAELESLKEKRLPHADSMLEGAAIGVAQEIRAWPRSEQQADIAADQQAAGQNDKPPGPPTTPAQALPAALAATMTSSDSTIAQAQQMLAQSGAVLEGRMQ